MSTCGNKDLLRFSCLLKPSNSFALARVELPTKTLELDEDVSTKSLLLDSSEMPVEGLQFATLMDRVISFSCLKQCKEIQEFLPHPDLDHDRTSEEFDDPAE